MGGKFWTSSSPQRSRAEGDRWKPTAQGDRVGPTGARVLGARPHPSCRRCWPARAQRLLAIASPPLAAALNYKKPKGPGVSCTTPFFTHSVTLSNFHHSHSQHIWEPPNHCKFPSSSKLSGEKFPYFHSHLSHLRNCPSCLALAEMRR
jgi:hypothetical protein